jgi:hypothetical protein
LKSGFLHAKQVDDRGILSLDFMEKEAEAPITVPPFSLQRLRFLKALLNLARRLLNMNSRDGDSYNGVQSFPLLERVSAENRESDVAALDDHQFQLHCEAGSSGRFEISAKSLSLRIGQRIFQDKAVRIWDSVVIRCTHDEEGSLLVKVDVCNPSWDEPLQIASVVSRVAARADASPLMNFDLTHKSE